MTHGKDIAQRRQTMFEPGYTEKVVNYCSGIAYTYKEVVDKPGGLPEIGGPAIGDRAPDVDFEHAGTLFDRLRHPYFTLLAMAGDGDLTSIVEPLKRRFSPLVAVEVLPRSNALAARYGASDNRLYLIRPDGYVACKAAAGDATRLQDHLAQTLTAAAKMM
jgi:hypothetical protein